MAKQLKSANIWSSFNGSTNYIQYADNDKFSMTDGVNDLPFEVEFQISSNNTSTTQWITRKHTSSAYEWGVYLTGSYIYLYLYTTSSANYIARRTAILLLNNIAYNIKITYDGSKLNTGIKLYVDNIEQSGNVYSAGTYTGMINSTGGYFIGYSSAFINGYLRNLKIKKNNQLVFQAPLQDSTAVSKDVIGGLTSSAGTLPTVVNLNDVVLKASDVWSNLQASNMTFGDTSTLGWMNSGVFNLQFDLYIMTKPTVSNRMFYSCNISNGHYGFVFNFNSNGIIYFYWENGTLVTQKTFTPLTNTKYKVILRGNGIQLQLMVYNNSELFYDSGLVAQTFVPNATTTQTPTINESGNGNINIRNIKIFTDFNGTIPFIFFPLQDTSYLDVVSGLVGSATNINIINKLETERWANFIGNTNISYGTATDWGWMNSGTFRMEFDLKHVKSPTTNYAGISTGASSTRRGFMFYFRTNNTIYLYWCNGSGSYGRILSPSALTLGTSYHYTLYGDGTNIRLIITNNDTGAAFYDSGLLSCVYVPNATTTIALRHGFANNYENSYLLKNFKVWYDADGTQPFFSISYQNRDSLYYDEINNMYGTIYNGSVPMVNNNQNALKSKNVYTYFNGTSAYLSYGGTSTFGWMNSGIFRIEFEYIPLSTKVSNSCIMTTAFTNGSGRGFRIYQGSTINFYHTNGSSAGTNVELTTDRTIGKKYRIHIWADGSRVYYTSYDENGINKQDLVGTPYTFIPAATTTYLLTLASLNSSASGTYNTACYMRNLKIYDANGNLFYFIPMNDSQNPSAEVITNAVGNGRNGVVGLEVT